MKNITRMNKWKKLTQFINSHNINTILQRIDNIFRYFEEPIIPILMLICFGIPAWEIMRNYRNSFDPNVVAYLNRSIEGLFMISIKN